MADRLMKLFSKSPERAAADKELKDARADLGRVSGRDRAETDAYLAANRRVIEAEQRVRNAGGRTPRF